MHFIFPFVVNVQNYTQSKITSKLFQNTLTRMCIAYFKAKNDVCAVATDNFKCTVVSKVACKKLIFNWVASC